jgi:hypothetical protein
MFDFGGRRGSGLAAAATCVLLGGSSAFAHPGHGRGGGDSGPAHYLTEPGHAVFAVTLVLVVALLAGSFVRSVRSRQRGRG